MARLAYRLGDPAEDAVHEAALRQVVIELDLVEVALTHSEEHAPDLGEDDEVDEPDEDQEGARHRGADEAERLLERRAVVLHLTGQRLDADAQEEAEAEDHAGVTEGEPEADRDRLLAVGDQLARRVVDRGDVIGVERVPHAERVGRDAQADTEDGPVPDAEVLRAHDPDQGAPAGHIEQQHECEHRDEDDPVLALEVHLVRRQRLVEELLLVRRDRRLRGHGGTLLRSLGTCDRKAIGGRRGALTAGTG